MNVEQLRKQIVSVNRWQWLCFLPNIVVLVTGSKAFDATIFVGPIVFVVLQIVKARYKQQLQMLEATHEQELEGQATSAAARKL